MLGLKIGYARVSDIPKGTQEEISEKVGVTRTEAIPICLTLSD